MPLYEYKCEKCGALNEFLIIKKASTDVLKCRECGSEKLKKEFSTFSVANKTETNFKDSGCCGATSPCDNPKRCCGR